MDKYRIKGHAEKLDYEVVYDFDNLTIDVCGPDEPNMITLYSSIQTHWMNAKTSFSEDYMHILSDFDFPMLAIDRFWFEMNWGWKLLYNYPKEEQLIQMKVTNRSK